MMGLYDCEYKIEFTTLDLINEKWIASGKKGTVAGAFYPDEKLIQVHSNMNLLHEYRHAYCYNYWVYHEQTNAEWCKDPHFLIVRNDRNGMAS
jgi:hypothetical protein